MPSRHFPAELLDADPPDVCTSLIHMSELKLSESFSSLLRRVIGLVTDLHIFTGIRICSPARSEHQSSDRRAASCGKSNHPAWELIE